MRATRWAVLAFVLSGFLALPAHAEEPPTQICNYVEWRAEQLIRVGDLKTARTLKPQLEACVKLHQAYLKRCAEQLISWYNEALAAELHGSTAPPPRFKKCG